MASDPRPVQHVPGATASLDARRVERALADVAAALWSERELLELILFRLTAQQLIVSARKTRWFKQADDEVDEALRQLQGQEIVRAAHVDVLVRAYDLAADATLADIVSLAPEPWSTVLDDHRAALRALTGEVERAAAENRALLDVGAPEGHPSQENPSDADR